MRNLPKITETVTITRSAKSDWIKNALINEFNLFSQQPLDACIMPCKSKQVYILYHGQSICIFDIIEGIAGRMNLLYKRCLRKVNHAWIQYWFIGKIHSDCLTELIESHERAFESLNYTVEILIDSLDIPDTIKKLQDEALSHVCALKILREKVATYTL